MLWRIHLACYFLAMTTKDFLDSYVSERLPQFQEGEYEGAPDIPHFTVDQRYIPLRNESAMA